jgi:uncharacterized protein (DUF302 family)
MGLGTTADGAVPLSEAEPEKLFLPLAWAAQAHPGINRKGVIMNIAIAAPLQASFDDAVARTREALAEQGFGVLTEIDVKATLKAKLGEEMEDYLILGACNPPLAHRAVEANRQIGLLLPCNVVVRADRDHAGTVLVEAMDPGLLVEVTGEPELRPVAEEVTNKMKAAIDSLRRSSPVSSAE